MSLHLSVTTFPSLCHPWFPKSNYCSRLSSLTKDYGLHAISPGKAFLTYFLDTNSLSLPPSPHVPTVLSLFILISATAATQRSLPIYLLALLGSKILEGRVKAFGSSFPMPAVSELKKENTPNIWWPEEWKLDQSHAHITLKVLYFKNLRPSNMAW